MSSVDKLESELPKKGFDAVDLLPGLVNQDGCQMDLSMRLSPEFDLKSELLRCRAKALAKTDCAALRDSRAGKRTSRFYNYPPRQFVGNY